MPIKDKSQYHASSFQLRLEDHKAMRELLDRLGLPSPGALMQVLAQQGEDAFEALRPVLAKHRLQQAERQIEGEKKAELAKELASKLTPAQLQALLAQASKGDAQ